MLLMGGDRIDEAVAHAAKVLRAVADRDWNVKAGGLDWSCLKTAEHIAGDFVFYAGQLTGRAADTYVPFEIALDEGTGPEGAIEVIEATGGMLAAVVRTTPRGVRAYHPYPSGAADATGFAAMGVAEVLLHTHDIARALGADAEPPADLCEAVLSHLFPHVPPTPAGGTPWTTLLWATGRGTLPGRAALVPWRWHNPLSLPAGPVVLREVTPAAAMDLAAGGTGGSHLDRRRSLRRDAAGRGHGDEGVLRGGAPAHVGAVRGGAGGRRDGGRGHGVPRAAGRERLRRGRL